MNMQVGGRIMDERSYYEVLQRRRELQEELRVLNEIIHGYERLKELRSGNAARTVEASSDDKPRLRERNVYSPRQLANFARAEILKRGRPMTRGELLDAFESEGIPLAGRDKARNLGTIMWRFREEFENVPGRGYWPKDVPNPDR
ncbi:hypothetical protein HCU64_23805 [Methylobacterium sp. C25]|uniref:hypothetical protein n=1 Tax=Methylobacterium sp. C25 TaxID=2721622 RepID=UPI001F274B0E|nr:hypothetical protein [Methylobacterium sp. C25]MCE4226771.1 hypothetical protein [Methylobacterium sp. C25]